MEATAQRTRLEVLSGVFLATAWFSHPPTATDPSLSYFLVEGEDEGKARELLRRYLEEKSGQWEIEELHEAQILRGRL